MKLALSCSLAVAVVALGIAMAPHAKAVTIPSPNTPIPIPDNSPVGVFDTITFPSLALQDVGGGVKISVDINNSTISGSGLTVELTDPNSVAYTLYAGSQTGTSLVATYSATSLLPSGDLSSWIGQNPTGNWTLNVSDLTFLNNQFDGQIVSWSVTANPVPEPSTMMLAAIGFAGLVTAALRRRTC